VIAMVTKGSCTSITGRTISVRADTICLHGDQEGALVFAQALRAALAEQSIAPRAFP
jgi:UPF0271 protein